MPSRNDELLEARLGYSFRGPARLDRALTHSSAAGEVKAAQESGAAGRNEPRDNEQLEFLGDAVLDLLASEYLLEKFPEWTEGQLSKSRARIVNSGSLEIAARRLQLGDHLRLGRGEEKTGGRDKPALLADALEAVIAAIYLDGGLDAARNVLRRVLFEDAIVEGGERIAESDRKSALQEFLQARGKPPAEYRLAGESGPDHKKEFRVEVWAGGERVAEGGGRSKKEAEHAAAREALELLARRETGAEQ